MKTNAKIYVMRAEDGTLKLGHSVDPERRAKQVGRAVEVVHETDVLEQVERIERLAHRVLALHGRHIRGEWFEASLDEAVRAIEIATRQAEQQELVLGGDLRRINSVSHSGRAEAGSWASPPTLSVRMDVEHLQMIDDLRRLESDLPTRTEMARRCIEIVAAERLRKAQVGGPAQ